MSDAKAPLPEVPPATLEQLPATSPDQQPATSAVSPDQQSAAPVTAAELPLGDAPGTVTAAPVVPDGSASVVSDTQPETKTYRTLDDYRALDWSKSNSQLARETGVTRQRIAQVKEQLFGKTGAPIQPQADFRDIDPTAAQSPHPGESPISPQAVVDYQLMGTTVFDMSTGTLVMVFGDEWKPQKPEEREVVSAALANYFKSKQLQDLPPGMMLTAVCLAYAAPRLRAPSTSSKLKAGWYWLRSKVSAFRNRNKAKSP